MLRRSLIISAEIIGITLILLSAGLFWASYYVDTDEFRQRFSDAVEQITGTPVRLEGELNIALYPALSLEALGLVVNGGPEDNDIPLVKFDTLRVSIRLLPLLSNQVDVRSIIVQGMAVNIVQNVQGELNWQSLIDRFSAMASDTPSTGNGATEYSLSELDVMNATIVYTDKKEGQSFGLSGINLRTGAIVPGRVVPFTAKSHFALKSGEVTSEIILKGMIKGTEYEGFTLEDSTLYASVGGAFLPSGANPGEMTARVNMDWKKRTIALDGVSVRFLGIRAEGNVQSDNFIQSLTGYGHLSVLPFKPADIVNRYLPDAPTSDIDGLKHGAISSDFLVDEAGLTLKNLVATLDDLTVRGGISMKGYAHPAFAFDLQSGVVDIDRYLPLFTGSTTPVVWDDITLDFFKAIRAQGKIKADGFKALDNTLSAVRLALNADDKAIRIDAEAIRKDQGGLAGNAVFSIGRNETTNMPTFGMRAHLTAHSQANGFDFLNIEPFKVTGTGQLTASVNVAQMDCPPQENVIGILRRTSGEIALSLGAGKGAYTQDASSKFSILYSKAECALKLSPVLVSKEGAYGFNTDLTLRGNGGKTVRTFSLTTKGPLTWDMEENHLASSGLQVKGSVAGTLYTDMSSRITANGKVAFDTEKGVAQIDEATVRTLETTVKGDAKLTDLNTSFKAQGKVEVPAANLRRVVYLLSKFALRTGTPEALKVFKLMTNFTADKDGFKLTELEGSLDGMSFNGEIVGHGLKDPKLAFTLSGGVLDIDRFIPPSSKPTLEERRAGKKHKAPPVDLPLAFFRWLPIEGKVWLEGLKLAKINATNVSGNIKADNGAINVSDVRGKIYGGLLKAGWVGEVGEKSLTTHLKLHVEDALAGPLMKDLVKRDYVRGETDVDLNLKSSGTTDDDIVANLGGTAWVRIRNGSFKLSGYDNSAPAHDIEKNIPIGGVSETRKRRTVFHKAMGYFTVEKGVFTVDKFRVESPPILQSYGQGNFSLPDETIDFAVRNDFVAVPSVTIEIKGDLSDPEVTVPKGKIVDDTVRNILSLPEKSFEFFRDLFQ